MLNTRLCQDWTPSSPGQHAVLYALETQISFAALRWWKFSYNEFASEHAHLQKPNAINHAQQHWISKCPATFGRFSQQASMQLVLEHTGTYTCSRIPIYGTCLTSCYTDTSYACTCYIHTCYTHIHYIDT
eukprot:1138478-Pelagomonas_calceolata.AAC.4